MNKNSNGKSSYRGLGSIDFQAAARSVLIVGRVKNEPEIRVVCHVKSSLAPEGKSIAFRLDKDTGFGWIGEYDISADDLLSGNCRGQKIKEAKEFLLEILADGAVEQNVIIKESESRGIKGKTLWNAKKALGIQSIKPGSNWSWVLPEQLVVGIAGTINQHGKITISLGTGNVATLKGDLDETGTDTAGIVCATDPLSSDGGRQPCR